MEINEVLNQIKDEKTVSISLIQRKGNMGFILANKTFKELEDKGYIYKSEKNNAYLPNKEKICKKLKIKPVQGLKIIFLDVDGVLNCRTTKDVVNHYVGIEDKKVELLKQLVKETNSKIVLVSTWKQWWYKEPQYKCMQDDLANYLDKKLARQGLTIMDSTFEYDLLDRGDGILKYILHLNSKGIVVDNFVILDDEMFDYKETKLTKHLVQTSYNNGGLQPKHIKKALEKLSTVM